MKKLLLVVLAIELLMVLTTGFVVLPSINPPGIQLRSAFTPEVVITLLLGLLAVGISLTWKKPPRREAEAVGAHERKSCNSCGAVVATRGLFCANCGTRFPSEVESVPPDGTKAEAVAPPERKEPQSIRNPLTMPSSRKQAAFLIFVAVVVGVTFYWWHNVASLPSTGGATPVSQAADRPKMTTHTVTYKVTSSAGGYYEDGRAKPFLIGYRNQSGGFDQITNRKYSWSKEIQASTGEVVGVQAVNPGGIGSAVPGVVAEIYVDGVLVQRSVCSVEGGIATVGYRIP